MIKKHSYVLGYSGLNDSLLFRKNNLSGLTAQEYRMTQGMDAAAVLLCDGVVAAAAEEERFIGIKHTEKFPVHAIQFCLSQAGISIEDVDFICHNFDYAAYQAFFQLSEYGRAYYQAALQPQVQYAYFKTIWPELPIEKRFVPVKHHFAHAASAFYPSGFNEALVLVADGMGEVDSISIFHGKDNQLQLLHRYDLLSSVGMLYSIITHHLGFSINSGEGKVMGLAPYGDPKRYQSVFAECMSLKPQGEIFINGFLKNTTELERETYRGFSQWLAERTFPPRTSEGTLSQEHMDLAASLQQALNQALMHLLTYWQKQTGLKQLCYAGGVALNCTTNGIILRSGLFNDVYVQPAAGDAGTALGAALYYYRQVLKQPGRDTPQRLPVYGPMPDIGKYLSMTADFLRNKQVGYYTLDTEEMLEQAAEMLVQGKIIAWVQGPMEFGPRALGHRSILADPRDPQMRGKINRIIKKREDFRPFAPSVKQEKAHLFFEIPTGSTKALSTMLFVVPVRSEHQQNLPAITHVDGTARVQTVDKNEHPLYWRLLDKFESKTGLPMLLNTSFNVRGQPIVNGAKEALETFMSIGIDAIFIENIMFLRVRNLLHAEL
ncbi:MAG: carbamoyltransferase [Proteobacteria bacterium]|nr:carbamoyltransferase [Pseudomonadota bacterium]